MGVTVGEDVRNSRALAVGAVGVEFVADMGTQEKATVAPEL